MSQQTSKNNQNSAASQIALTPDEMLELAARRPTASPQDQGPTNGTYVVELATPIEQPTEIPVIDYPPPGVFSELTARRPPNNPHRSGPANGTHFVEVEPPIDDPFHGEFAQGLQMAEQQDELQFMDVLPPDHDSVT